MPDDAQQPADTPKRPRTARSPSRAGRKQPMQATPSITPEQEAAVSLVTQVAAGRTAQQPLAASETSAQLAPDGPPIGERWGEFPPVARQAELKGMLEAWKQEQDHGNRPGPFAGDKLSGADVYWLANILGIKNPVPAHNDLSNLHLECADLSNSQLERAILGGANLQGAFCEEANLEGATLLTAHLESAYLRKAQLAATLLAGAYLERAFLREAHLERAFLILAHLEGAFLVEAHLEGASLNEAHLEGANLREAYLEGADLSKAHLEGANLSKAHLTHQVNLREATFDGKTQLAEADLDATLQVADVAWNGVSLIRVLWVKAPRLGDEAIARQLQTNQGVRKSPRQRLEDFEAAARAYRQLAIVLRGQGLTEPADRFTYRALIMQRKALWWQMRSIPLLAQPTKKEEAKHPPKQLQASPLRRAARQMGNWLTGILTLGRLLGSYLFSWFLALLTGYGYRMSRIIVAYLLINCAFALAYWSIGVQHPRDISFWTALIVSVTAFHGRVFTNPFMTTLPDAQITIAAIEAIVGLVIEGIFIAMLTQRFFNR